jgi:HD-like signal output (HDOD) protein
MSADERGTRADGERGWLRWLSRWFGGPAPATPSAGRRRAAQTAAVGAAHPDECSVSGSVDLPEAVPAPGFDAFAAALGLVPTVACAWSEAELAEVERLCAAVKDHFAAERDNLEMLPSSSLRILNLVSRPDAPLSELTSVASQDPAISAAVLRVANSAAVSTGTREIRTVREAIARLGVNEIGRVAGAVSARALFSSKAKAEQAMFAARRSELHLQAVTTAAGAAHLAMERRHGRSDLAYLGGILHDVGKAVALSSLSALILAGRAKREVSPSVLTALLERVHTELGTQALRHWSMPGYLIELCATHHDGEVPSTPQCAEVHLVRIVSGLLALRSGVVGAETTAALLQSLSALGIKPLELRALDAHVRGLSQQMGQVLGLESASPATGARGRAFA